MESEAQKRARQKYQKSEKGKERNREYKRSRYHDPNSGYKEYLQAKEKERDRSGHCDQCGQWKNTLKRKSSPTICAACYEKEKYHKQ